MACKKKKLGFIEKNNLKKVFSYHVDERGKDVKAEKYDIPL